MAARFFMVRNDGTAPAASDDGVYTSKETGAFANALSNDWGAKGFAANDDYFYGNISDAIAALNPPISGDFILVSDVHSHTVTSNISYSGAWTNNVFIVAVDDANVDAGRTSGNRGEELQLTSGQNITVKNVTISGMKFIVGNDFLCQGNVTLYDGENEGSGPDDLPLAATTDSTSITATKMTLTLNTNSDALIGVTNAVRIDLVNCDTSTSQTNIAYLTQGFGNGGGVFRASGCDFTLINDTLIANVGADADVDDLIDVHLDMCVLHADVSLVNETFKSQCQRALFTRCSDSSAAAEFQYFLRAFGGDVEDDSAIFRNESPAFTDSNQKISYKITTNSDASVGSPLWFDIPLNKWSVLSNIASQELTLYITSDDTITDVDVYPEVIYPDGTNKQTPNFLSGGPLTVGGTIDLMATPTTLTTDGDSTWTNGLTNKYKIPLDTSVDIGADTYPILRVYITKASSTINLSMDFDIL